MVLNSKKIKEAEDNKIVCFFYFANIYNKKIHEIRITTQKLKLSWANCGIIVLFE